MLQGTILTKVNTVLALDKDDPAKEDSVKDVSSSSTSGSNQATLRDAFTTEWDSRHTAQHLCCSLAWLGVGALSLPASMASDCSCVTTCWL